MHIFLFLATINAAAAIPAAFNPLHSRADPILNPSDWGLGLPAITPDESIGQYLNRLLNPDDLIITARSVLDNGKVSSNTWQDTASGYQFNISVADSRCDKGIKPSDKVGVYTSTDNVEHTDFTVRALIADLYSLKRNWSPAGSAKVQSAYFDHCYANLETALAEAYAVLDGDMLCTDRGRPLETHHETMRRLLIEPRGDGLWLSIVYGGIASGVVGGGIAAAWEYGFRDHGGIPLEARIAEVATISTGTLVVGALVALYRERRPQQVGQQEAWVVTIFTAWFRGIVRKIKAIWERSGPGTQGLGHGGIEMTCASPQAVASAAVAGIADTAGLVEESGVDWQEESMQELLSSMEAGKCVAGPSS